MAQLRKQSTELNRLKKMKDEYEKTVKKMTERKGRTEAYLFLFFINDTIWNVYLIHFVS